MSWNKTNSKLTFQLRKIGNKKTMCGQNTDFDNIKKNEHIAKQMRCKEIIADICNTKCLKVEKEYYNRKWKPVI